MLLCSLMFQIPGSGIPTLRGAIRLLQVYQVLTSHEPPILDASDNLIWHSQVPLKVSILAWHLLRDMLPTKINLLNRGILSAADTYCSAGCGQLESAQHLFLHCDVFGIIWQQVRSWIDVDHHSLCAHFFSY